MPSGPMRVGNVRAHLAPRILLHIRLRRALRMLLAVRKNHIKETATTTIGKDVS